MKKLFLTLSAIAFMFVSCTNADNESTSTTEGNGSVTFGITTPSPEVPVSTTGKVIVQRGTITNFISSIIVKATGPTNKTETFRLLNWWETEDGVSGATADTDFKLGGLLAGTYKFALSTTVGAYVSPWWGFSGVSYDPNVPESDWNSFKSTYDRGLKGNKDQLPYVIYKGEISGQLVTGEPKINKLNVLLTTKQGRLISVFTLAPDITAAKNVVKITAQGYTSKAAKLAGANPLFTSFENNFSEYQFTCHKWSAENCVAEAIEVFKIEIFAPNAHTWEDTPIKTYSIFSETVEASTSKSTHYVIGLNDVTVGGQSVDDMRLRFQDWNEQPTKE